MPTRVFLVYPTDVSGRPAKLYSHARAVSFCFIIAAAYYGLALSGAAGFADLADA